MLKDFVSSYGFHVREREHRLEVFRDGFVYTLCGSGVVESIEEYFQAKRDKELGRWRWPENPNYLVYPHEDGDFALVVSEVSGDSTGIYLEADRRTGSNFERAAVAYFAARPEPKPWHDAKPGEVWVLRVRDESEERPYTVGDTGFNGEDIRGEYWGAIPLESHVFTAGRRIWPEIKEEQ